jgi:uroporphyrinogen-III synthase
VVNQVLAGKRIIVTRAPEQAGELVGTLEAMGAEVSLMPTVRFAPPEDWSATDEAIRRLPEFDWILLTSQNAARFFCLRCRELGLGVGSVGTPKLRVATVGPATAEAATQEGLRVDFVAKRSTGEALARELTGSLRNKHVLLPRSDRGDSRLPAALREAGAQVSEVIVYRTAAPEKLDAAMVGRLRRAEVDAIVFASPSAFHNLCDAIDAAELAKLAGSVHFAAIGPTTAQALRQSGLRPEIEASESSSASLADSIAKYFQQHPSRGERT